MPDKIQMPYQAAIFVVAISPLVGSFVALLADRLPRGEDVLVKRSYCRSCAHPLGALDLIPLLTFLFTFGRCRHCGSLIPWHLFAMELSALIIGVWAVWHAPGEVMMIVQAFFMWSLLGLFVADARFFRLPNTLTLATFVFAFVWVWHDPNKPIFDHLLTGALAGLVFWIVRKAYYVVRGEEGLGLGDVKLVIGLGTVAGPFFLPILILNAAILAILFSVCLSLKNGTSLNAKLPLPFGSFLCVSTALLWANGVL